jgi:type I restriction enzyme S subunit
MQNGKHAIARGLVDEIGFGSTEFHVIRPGSEIIPEWVHGFVRQPWVLKEAIAHFSGSVGQQRVPESYLANLQISFPLVSEQRHIVAKLRDKIEALDKAKRASVEVVKTMSAMVGAALHEAFSGGL